MNCFDQYAEPYIDLSSYPTFDRISRAANGKLHDLTWYGWRITIDTWQDKAWWDYVASFPDLGQEPVTEKELKGWRPLIDEDLLDMIKVVELLTGLTVESPEEVRN